MSDWCVCNNVLAKKYLIIKIIFIILIIYAYAYIICPMKIDDLSQVFKCLSEPIRLRILNLLITHGELCVCNIVDALEISQGVVSRHLAYLRNNNILKSRREGTWIYYQIVETDKLVQTIITQLKMNGFNSPEFKNDLTKFSKLQNSCK